MVSSVRATTMRATTMLNIAIYAFMAVLRCTVVPIAKYPLIVRDKKQSPNTYYLLWDKANGNSIHKMKHKEAAQQNTPNAIKTKGYQMNVVKQ